MRELEEVSALAWGGGGGGWNLNSYSNKENHRSGVCFLLPREQMIINLVALKQHKCTLFHFCRLEIWHGSPWAVFLPGSSRTESISLPFPASRGSYTLVLQPCISRAIPPWSLSPSDTLPSPSSTFKDSWLDWTHPENPGSALLHKVLNLITLTKAMWQIHTFRD